MGHFVADHGLDFFAGHALQQAGGHGHQRRVLERARGKGIGVAFKDADFGHADARLVGKLAHGLDDPALVGRAGAVDHAHARGPLGHGLADEQRDDGAAKAHDQREAQQRAQVQAVGGEIAVYTQQAGHHPKHQHDGQVGQYK